MRQIALNFLEMHQLEIRLNSASVEVEVEDELGKNELGMSSPELSLVGLCENPISCQTKHS